MSCGQISFEGIQKYGVVPFCPFLVSAAVLLGLESLKVVVLHHQHAGYSFGLTGEFGGFDCTLKPSDLLFPFE
jgi:hypothetical protein